MDTVITGAQPIGEVAPMQPTIFSTAMPLAAVPSGDAPEWIHLVPAGTFTAVDGRGPFTLGDAQAVIAASMVDGRKLPIDVNHAIDHLSSKGEQAPAFGWVVAMEARPDGVWGKVEWNEDGRGAVGGRRYGFISPVLLHSKAKPHTVTRILRASLTNDPALTGLASLNTKQTGDPSMDEELRAALGLAETADQAAIVAAATEAFARSTALATIAEAGGVARDATVDTIVSTLTAQAKKAAAKDAGADEGEVEELRGQVAQLTARLTTLSNDTAKEKAEAAVDRAIEQGKVVPSMRDHFIARHIKNPQEVEAEIKLLPSLFGGGLGLRPVLPGDDADGLSAADQEVCEMMGLDPKRFAEQAKATKETF